MESEIRGNHYYAPIIHKIVGSVARRCRAGEKVISASTLIRAVDIVSSRGHRPLDSLEAEAEQRRAIRTSRRCRLAGDTCLSTRATGARVEENVTWVQ
jgi:hypothetical protein